MADGKVDYHTHILIGVHASGTMTVICHWSHVPRQADVQDQIGKTREPYTVSSVHAHIDPASAG